MNFQIIDRNHRKIQHTVGLESLADCYRLKQSIFINDLKNEYSHKQIYIHVPFCFFHCSFCVYRGQLLTNKTATSKFIDDLETEMIFLSEQFKSVYFDSVFIGGGTVSTLSSVELDKLLVNVFKYFNIHKSNKNEFSVEMAPHGLNTEKIDLIKQHGATRITMGIQSMEVDLLKRMNRPALPIKKIENIFQYIKSSNFNDFNVDLMVGIDGRTTENLISDFEYLEQQGCNSIMVYIEMGQYREDNNSKKREIAIKQINTLMDLKKQKFNVNGGATLNEYNRFTRKGKKVLDFQNRYITDIENYNFLCLGLGPGASSFTKEYMFKYEK